MIVKLLTEHHLEFLSLTEGCTGSSESILVKMPHFLKSCVMAHIYLELMFWCILVHQLLYQLWQQSTVRVGIVPEVLK